MRKEQIEQEINKYGAKFFEAVRQTIIDRATEPLSYNPEEHKNNKDKLIHKVDKLSKISEYNASIGIDDLWKLMYELIFYSGTRAKKASDEIESFEKYSVFSDFRKLVHRDWNFDKKEWVKFRKYYKNIYGSSWLKHIINNKNARLLYKTHFKNTGIKAFQLMTKTGEFKGIKFSAMEDKMVKYITVAKHLFDKENSCPGIPILEQFTGPNYKFEDYRFWGIHCQFAYLLGEITAFHLMMDLGFNTVKPDRVLTYLFSKLGWLEVFPPEVTKEYVNKNYNNPRVWRDVIDKALHLKKVIPDHYSNPLRQIDIWIVKYGQQPEDSFGITKNLQKEYPIEQLYKDIKSRIN